jgi:WD40 repeat protein
MYKPGVRDVKHALSMSFLYKLQHVNNAAVAMYSIAVSHSCCSLSAHVTVVLSITEMRCLLALLQGDPSKQVQLRGHDDELTAFAMSPGGSMLATGQRGQNSDVVVWDTKQLAQKFRCVFRQ